MVYALKPIEGSKQLAAYHHDPATGVLAVRFHGHKGKPGPTYHLKDVDAKKVAAFEAAPSKGAFYNAHLRGHHEFERMPDYETAGMASGA